MKAYPHPLVIIKILSAKHIFNFRAGSNYLKNTHTHMMHKSWNKHKNCSTHNTQRDSKFSQWQLFLTLHKEEKCGKKIQSGKKHE
jgi:hypothetical protein